MDITLGDLIVLEPRLVVDGDFLELAGSSSLDDGASVSWAVSARTTPPHLPLLRGGELLIVPNRVTAEIGEELSGLLREAALREVSAVVLESNDRQPDKTYPASEHPRILRWADDLTLDTETTINRLLNECRGNLFQIGSELERQMADVSASNSGIKRLVQVAAETSGLSLAVVDAHGQRIASAREGERAGDDDASDASGLFNRALPSGANLIVGPVGDRQRVLARFLIGRIAAAANAALHRDKAARPRGHKRAEAMAALLTWRDGSAVDQRTTALALGLDPDAVFYVAVSNGTNESALARLLAPLGTAHPAGGVNGLQATVVATRNNAAAELLAGRLVDLKKRWETEHGNDTSLLALSTPAVGVSNIPSAAKEAAFVAALQTHGQLARRAASFGSIDDIGAMRLLYHLRDSAELRSFIAETLGNLETRDHRGSLRTTLQAYLESGGSRMAAAQRLGIHRNTLAYRLRRISELIGRDLADPGSWLILHLALSAMDMLDVCAGEG